MKHANRPASTTPVPAVHLVVQEGHVLASSLDVAKVFGKQHKDVLKAIGSLAVPSDWRRRNFEQTVTERKNPSGGAPIKSPAINMTRDGFTILAMGFTGKQAMRFKLAYIEAFNAMEAELHNPRPAPPAMEVKRQEVRAAAAHLTTTLGDAGQPELHTASLTACAVGDLLGQDALALLGMAPAQKKEHLQAIAPRLHNRKDGVGCSLRLIEVSTDLFASDRAPRVVLSQECLDLFFKDCCQTSPGQAITEKTMFEVFCLWFEVSFNYPAPYFALFHDSLALPGDLFRTRFPRLTINNEIWYSGLALKGSAQEVAA